MAKLDSATVPPNPARLQEQKAHARPLNWGHLGQECGALAACILLLVFNCIFTPHFWSFQTLSLNLQQMSATAIVAIGMTLVIGTGGIDLSVGAVMAIVG